MKLVVGLGNPGNEYNFTRHNFGFLALDFYAKIRGFSWEKEKHGALWAKVDDTIFIKPQTFYNDSGQAVRAFADYYKIPSEDILIVCDDFNLDFGRIRYRAHGQSGGSNGLKSIISHLGTENFPRLRLGTDNAMRAKIGDIDFVLGRFTSDEREKLPEILSQIASRIDERLQNKN